METQPEFGFKELFTFVIGGMARALCERSGETQSRQLVRSHAATRMIMAFSPRDTIEAMLAGHCVMLHEMMVDSVEAMFPVPDGPARRNTRGAILAMDKAFGRNLANLQRYQKRQAEGQRDAPEASAVERPNEPDIADRVRRHQATSHAPAAVDPTPATQAQEDANAGAPPPPDAMPWSAGSPAFYPSRAAIADCMANTVAMAALRAGDAAGFARAMGVRQPCDAYVAAASTQMSEMNGHGVAIEAASDPTAHRTA